MSDFDAEREANIARNRALLAELNLTAGLDIPPKKNAQEKKSNKAAKPVQSRKRPRRDTTPPPARETRQSARLKQTTSHVPDPNETPAQRKRREKEEAEQRAKEEEARLEAEEKLRQAKRPRHQDLDISTLAEELEDNDLLTFNEGVMQVIMKTKHPRGIADENSFAFENDKEDQREVKELKERLKGMKVVARAKVTEDRVYSAAYHPEVTKDLIFFGDKHGQLGIWDARAPIEEVADADGEVAAADNSEGGKYWRLQPHWPATSKSSISCIKFDPIDSHLVYTSSYDCTIRRLSFSSGISREVYSSEDTLISSFDMPPSGNEMWISDASGGVTHLDLRQDKTKARWYQLSDQKIGSVSVNPVNDHFILTASNSRVLKVWDTRSLADIKHSKHQATNPMDFDSEVIEGFISSKQGKTCLRGNWQHGKSVSSAYWDPRGRGIVSTCYDDSIRLWDVKPQFLKKDAPFPTFRPITQIKHDCQTGRWLTILKAQWSPNPDIYPHFTVGNMQHSLDIISCKGDLIAKLMDKSRITAVQAVTCSHPSIVERAASGNASGRCVLWAPSEES
ncbi:WD repeat-containing DNA damage-binding protein [Abortiporus biennis]